ncbi:hypothetical protein DW2_07088 [Thioclava atlantica]|uniref:Uncharacterized protein n=1 Tax=Thioclava atlantica TaxID=1317124 RepID=A0A085TYB1_9RHOB|nr:hypothetical protein DW2_07088 [Thioclava atlantica]
MKNNDLLAQIWEGSVTCTSSGSGSQGRWLAAALLPAQTVVLCSTREDARFLVLPEAEELLPGISLGDVLVEELGIEVPYGSLIVIEPAHGAEAKHGNGDRAMDLRLPAMASRGRDGFAVHEDGRDRGGAAVSGRL